VRLTRDRGEVRWTLSAALLVAAFLLLALRHVQGQDPTYDERSYFGLGRAILRGAGWDGAALLHPPLSYYVASLPLLGARETPAASDAGPLLAARLTSLVVFGVPLLVAVLVWSRALYGRASSLVALALAAFSPTLLAHAPLITPDLALASTGFIATYLSWRRPRSLAWAAALGLALLAKAAAVLFAAAIAALALLRARVEGARTLRRVALGFVVSWLVLLLGYGFSGMFDGASRQAVLDRTPPALRAPLSAAALVLPPPYLRMLGRQSTVAARGWPSFLLGEISDRGFPHYYLVALAVKETIPFLVLLLAAALSLRFTPFRPRDEPALLVPAALFLLVFSLGTVQIGIRYVLPALPFLYVFASRVAAGGAGRRGVAAVALAVAHAVVAVRGGPDYLSYFNALAGGSENGWRVLGDSNVDWGQNRSRAEEYARRHGAAFEPLVLPEEGLVVVSTNRVQGTMDPRPYRRLRDEYEPVDRIGRNWLVYDLARNRRFPERRN
jgi:hypothetical protein